MQQQEGMEGGTAPPSSQSPDTSPPPLADNDSPENIAPPSTVSETGKGKGKAEDVDAGGELPSEVANLAKMLHLPGVSARVFCSCVVRNNCLHSKTSVYFIAALLERNAVRKNARACAHARARTHVHAVAGGRCVRVRVRIPHINSPITQTCAHTTQRTSAMLPF